MSQVLAAPKYSLWNDRHALAIRSTNMQPAFWAKMNPSKESNISKAKVLQKRSPRSPLPDDQQMRDAQHMRRQHYLSKVRQTSDEHRWNRRSDQILRQQYLDQKRSWESEKASSAPLLPVCEDDYVGDKENEVDDSADDVLRHEKDALEVLIAWSEDCGSAEYQDPANAAHDTYIDEDLDQFLTEYTAYNTDHELTREPPDCAKDSCKAEMDTSAG